MTKKERFSMKKNIILWGMLVFILMVVGCDNEPDAPAKKNPSTENPDFPTANGINPIQLTENQWADGNISTPDGVQWFVFTATVSKQYIHVNFGTLKDLYVRLYDSNGDIVGTINLYGSTGSTSNVYWLVTSGQKYYIKIWPYSSSGSGSYQITFSSSSSTPSESSNGGGTWSPPCTPIQLTISQWTNGSITSSGGVQWFTFTATASTHYIHVIFGTLSDLYVQLYDSSGNTVNSSTNLYGSTKYTSRSVTSGQKYYIKVWPYSSSDSGSYQITFSSSSSTPSGSVWSPPSEPIQLTVNQWSNGNISTSSGEQWFTFTATAYTQYIHVIFGTLSDLYVQLYDSSGNTVNSSTNLYSSTKYTSRSVTYGQKYYIKVWPYSSSGSYQITFSSSSSTPNSGSGGGLGGNNTCSHVFGNWVIQSTTGGIIFSTRTCTLCGWVDSKLEK